MSEPTIPAPQRSRHWFDFAAGAAAIVVSVVSLVVAKQTADANTQLVEASKWPFLQLDSSNTDGQNRLKISLAITNSGVGPAKVETFEVFWKGKAFATSQDLLAACCGYQPTVVPGTHNAVEGPTTGTVSNAVIRAGETRFFFALPYEATTPEVWRAVDRARLLEISYRACYCSVFDECWTTDLTSLHATPIDHCAKPAVAYRE